MSKIPEDELLPLDELYRNIPALKKLGWTPRTMAALCRTGFLEAHRNTHTNSWYSSVEYVRATMGILAEATQRRDYRKFASNL